ncbi:hypothetical protein IP79_00895 [Porphyrobacter sp. AAP60]|nr:hypothetical protein IP79_00895 [Porphyrobacter sp. AAP60]
MEGLEKFHQGAAFEDLPFLVRLMRDHAAARAFADALITPFLAALRAEPLAQLPLGHSSAPGMARLRMATHGRAGVTLLAIAPRARAMPVSVLFEDCEAHEIILAGECEAAVHRREAGGLVSEVQLCSAGTRFNRKGPDAARQIIAVARPLLVLQLTREPDHPQPSQEIATADGALLKVISASKASSQHMMALGVLGALEHHAALHPIARLAKDAAADRDVRWEAMRQCLALDTGEGLAVLAALARDPGDALQAAACALQRQLLAAHPDLAAMMEEPA